VHPRRGSGSVSVSVDITASWLDGRAGCGGLLPNAKRQWICCFAKLLAIPAHILHNCGELW